MSRSVIACLLPALAALPMLAGCDRKMPSSGQGDATTAPAPSPADPVPSAQVDRSHRGEAPPAAAARLLAPHLGRPLLVNLWATWCAPCVKELPTLDAAARAHPGLTVLLASQDTDAAKVAPFLAAHGVSAPASLPDPKLTLSVAYAANLPTTILYGADGRERWRYAGSLDWTGPQAAKLLAEAG